MPKLEQFFEKTLVCELCLKNELITIPIEPMLSTKRVCLKQSNGRIEHTDDALRLLLCYFSKCQWQICVRLIIATHFCAFHGGSHIT